MEVGGQELPLRGAVRKRALGGMGVPGEGVPEEDALRVAAQGAPDDAPRGFEPEPRPGARGPEGGPRPGEPPVAVPRELALAGEGDAREPASPEAERLAQKDQPRLPH